MTPPPPFVHPIGRRIGRRLLLAAALAFPTAAQAAQDKPLRPRPEPSPSTGPALSIRDRGAIAADADLANVAAGIATLSFGLGFLDQVVFGRDDAGICAMVGTLAHTIAHGLTPR